MWIKICGITSEADALMAVAMGADAVGFVFAPSSRQITPLAARDIVRRLPPEISSVGVFKDQAPRIVTKTVVDAGLTGAQLHGAETPEVVRDVKKHAKLVIKAMSATDPSVDFADNYGADALLLDGVNPGSGVVFDWELTSSVPPHVRVILAGGLTSDNVGRAIEQARPYGVDVSTGVESSPGVKDPRLVRAFIERARAASPRTEPRVFQDSHDFPFNWSDEGDA